MAKTATKRIWLQLSGFVASPSKFWPFRCFQSRAFSQALARRANEKDPVQNSPLSSIIESISPNNSRKSSKLFPPGPATKTVAKPENPLADLSSFLLQNQVDRAANAPLPSLDSNYARIRDTRFDEPHHLHVYSHKHNTHVTLTRPNRSPIISMSTGNIGFRKAGRKTYDAAFQLAAYVMDRIQDQGLNMEIKALELTLRGFGPGREAVTKALLGTEGRFLKGKVVKVSDATKLKFGGTRSKKPRRLG